MAGMSEHQATVVWERSGQPFLDQRYSRVHQWTFDGGAVVRASASPHVVPLPMSDAAAVDPEEAFVASLSSCHMLWFLSLAAGKGIVVDHYEDQAVATLGKNTEGKLAITSVVLRPRVTVAPASLERLGDLPGLHESAHERCFIAHSVRCPITIEPRSS